MEAATRYANSDGLSIAYQVHGEGPLDLVLVPGFVSHVELIWEEPMFARFLRRLLLAPDRLRQARAGPL